MIALCKVKKVGHGFKQIIMIFILRMFYFQNCFEMYLPEDAMVHTIKAAKTDSEGRVVEGTIQFLKHYMVLTYLLINYAINDITI